MAQDTAHAKQRTERADPWAGAKWPRTPHTHYNTRGGHTGEQEPSCPGHLTHTTQHAKRAHRCTGAKWPKTPHKRNTTCRAGTPVNRSQVAQDTA